MNYRDILKLAALIGTITSAPILAASKAPLTPQQLCDRLRITEEVIILDATGKSVIDVMRNERGTKEGLSKSASSDNKNDTICETNNSSGQSSTSFDGPIYFSHTWSVKTDGTLEVTYEQGKEFKGRGRDAKLVGSTGPQKKIVKDLETISWVSPFHDKQRVIIKLTPSLSEGIVNRDLGKFPIMLESATIYDGAGRLWTVNLTAQGEFIGVTTVYGGLIFSFQPFPGGHKIAKAIGNEIKFKNKDGATVVIKSDSKILPGDLASDVYVSVDPSMKAESISSQSISSGDDPNEVIERMKKRSAK